MHSLLLVWNLQEAATKPPKQFSKEVLMIWESRGSCGEAVIDGLEYPGSCWEST